VKKINIITMGCSKNLVDSERLARQFHEAGYKVIFDSEEFTDTIVINTCGFIGDAKEESIQTILNAVHAKQEGKVEQVHVIGCLSERYADDLRKEIPEVDSYLGNKGYIEILKELQIEAKTTILNERSTSTPKHTAYLKIAEGCDRSCSYCAIPSIRGGHVTESIENLLFEAQFLASQGAKELALISQDLSYYGYDLYGKNRLADLVRKLIKIDKVEWIRLHYLYPNNFPLEMLDIMNDSEKLCNYIDMPLQHASNKILQLMRRGFTKEKTYDLLDTIKSKVPDIALRSTLIVGHPDETEEDFQQLVDFVKYVEFDRLGVFTYSHEEGTHAGDNYKDNVPQKIKEERQDVIMRLQQDISLKKNEALIGKEMKVLIDRVDDQGGIGRTQYDALDVDNEIIIPNTDLVIGDFYKVKIESADIYDIFGRVI